MSRHPKILYFAPDPPEPAPFVLRLIAAIALVSPVLFFAAAVALVFFVWRL